MSATKFSSYPAKQFDEHNSNQTQQGGRPVLQHCQDCGVVQYPSREVCRSCLSGALVWKPIEDDLAVVASGTELHHSLETHYLERAPWHIATVRPSLNAIGSILVHSAKPRSAGDQVRLAVVHDHNSTAVLLAVSPEEEANAVWQALEKNKESDHD